MRKIPQICLLIYLCLPSLHAIDLDLGFREGLRSDESPAFTEDFIAGIEHQGNGLGFIAKLSINDAKLYGLPFHGIYYGPFSIDVKEAGTSLSLGGMDVKAGILSHGDIVLSPYSLFVNGLKRSAPIISLAYEDERFLFTDKWIGLGIDSSQGWPDRGAVQKNYAIKAGAFRFGFQDVAVFSSSYFDLTYFMIPLPSFFVQYIASAPGRPWTEAADDNSIMGFFADYSKDEYYAYAQLLVDDFNSNRLWAPNESQNPDKLAWSIGGTMDIEIKDLALGKFGIYHAGATAYTFESIGAVDYNPMYGYSYYPSDSFSSGATILPIAVEDNMVGYQHGENNLSFLLTWAREIFGVEAAAELEFTISGSKSAGNPWHDFVYYTEGGQGTRLLDDAVLEKKLLLRGKANYPWKDFVFSLDFSIGGVWNRLRLRTVDSTDSANRGSFFSPSDENAFIGSLGFSVHWKPRF
jgi:hypothetical protein